MPGLVVNDQESDQEKRKTSDNSQEKKKRKHALDKESVKKKRKISFVLDCFLGRFLGQERVFFFSYFLVFYKFPPQLSDGNT